MDKNVQAAILDCLKKNKSSNTFKLARNLGIERPKIIRELHKMQEEGLIRFRTGAVRFLGTSKALQPEIAIQPEAIGEPKVLIAEPARSISLAKKAKSKSRTIRQDGLKSLVSFQKKQIEELESQVQKLRRKAVTAKTKIIRKVIVRRIPAKNEISKETSNTTASPNWLSNISQLSKPKALEQKIELKRSQCLDSLKNSISQLEIPEMLKKGG